MGSPRIRARPTRTPCDAAHDHADKVRKHGEIAVWIHLALFALLIVLLLFETAMRPAI